MLLKFTFLNYCLENSELRLITAKNHIPTFFIFLQFSLTLYNKLKIKLWLNYSIFKELIPNRNC